MLSLVILSLESDSWGMGARYWYFHIIYCEDLKIFSVRLFKNTPLTGERTLNTSGGEEDDGLLVKKKKN